ncbi:hypothetical protein [Raineyella fluvialis]|nr:hypothetical protein [Raineyella fluvialis]
MAPGSLGAGRYSRSRRPIIESRIAKMAVAVVITAPTPTLAQLV